jgi:hypothetical protein
LNANIVFICLAIFAVSVLYSSVGHAGASGYIAVLTLFGFAPAAIKPTVLILNILVACIGTYQFFRAGHFSWKLFWPFAVLSVPFAFVGGYLVLPSHIFRVIVGCVLLCSAARLFFKREEPGHVHPPNLATSIPVGAGIGFLSGITGTGGGIFLTPLLLFFRWGHTKTAAAISALFILVNSISGLFGYVSSRQPLSAITWPLAATVVVGGTLGSYLGSKRLTSYLIRLALACVLTIAGLKLILT